MLNLSREQKGNILVIQLSGAIDESTDFKQLMGVVKPGTQIDCKDIKRINSAGVKAWIKYFQDPAVMQAKLTLLNCPPALVEQFNMFSNFAGNMTIDSIISCFLCSQCKTESFVSMRTADIVKANLTLSPVKCPKCGGTAEFDDDPEEYFRFLRT